MAGMVYPCQHCIVVGFKTVKYAVDIARASGVVVAWQAQISKYCCVGGCYWVLGIVLVVLMVPSNITRSAKCMRFSN